MMRRSNITCRKGWVQNRRWRSLPQSSARTCPLSCEPPHSNLEANVGLHSKVAPAPQGVHPNPIGRVYLLLLSVCVHRVCVEDILPVQRAGVGTRVPQRAARLGRVWDALGSAAHEVR